MPVQINPASEYAKELRRWEQHNTLLALDENGEMHPGNPYTFRPYPMMLYRANIWPKSGQPMTQAPIPDPYQFDRADQLERAQLEADRFNKTCQMLVDNEDQERAEKNNGWRNSPAEAMARYEAVQREIGNAAAERHAADARMSEKAQREAAAADAATHEHVPDPTTPEVREAVKEAKRGTK